MAKNLQHPIGTISERTTKGITHKWIKTAEGWVQGERVTPYTHEKRKNGRALNRNLEPQTNSKKAGNVFNWAIKLKTADKVEGKKFNPETHVRIKLDNRTWIERRKAI